MKLTPLFDNVVIRRDEAPAKIGNIHLPDAAKEKEKLHFGVVVARGDGKEVYEGGGWVLSPMRVKVGDRVVFAPYTGNEVKVGDEMLWIFPQESILAVVGK